MFYHTHKINSISVETGVDCFVKSKTKEFLMLCVKYKTLLHTIETSCT